MTDFELFLELTLASTPAQMAGYRRGEWWNRARALYETATRAEALARKYESRVR